MSSPHEYFRQWRTESNPWIEAYRADGGPFLVRFSTYFALFAFLNWAGGALGRRCGPPLSSRPTVIAATFHAAATSIVAIYLLFWNRGGGGGDDDDDGDGGHPYALWQEFAVPLSLAYFVADVLWYCVPKRDVLITIHHLIMCFCHFPVVSDAGAALAGAGDVRFAVWLSIAGYTSEISTVMMNYRWYLLKTLESGGDGGGKTGRSGMGFAVINVLVALSWAFRVCLFAYLLVFEISDRAPLYVAKKQLLSFVVCVAGHASIGLLSMHWFLLMCRHGVRGLLVFEKKKGKTTKGDDGGFSFGSDIGRAGQENGKRTAPSSPGGLSRRGLEEETRAFVDGTLFDANGEKKGDEKKD